MVKNRLSNFGGGVSFDGELDRYLLIYSKINSSNLPPYYLKLHRKGDPFWIVRDTTYAFELQNYEHTIALIDFDVGEEDILIIRQIQGDSQLCDHGNQEYLAPLKWERMLLRITIDWASQHGFRQVRVQRAEDNKWWSIDIPPEPLVEHQERLRMRYNVTAKRSGLRFNTNLNCYVLDL